VISRMARPCRLLTVRRRGVSGERWRHEPNQRARPGRARGRRSCGGVLGLGGDSWSPRGEQPEREMYEGEPQNEFDRWSVRAQLVQAGPGAAVVAIRLKNAAFGELPPFNLRVDWRPGMEAIDAEAFALQLAGQSAGFLSTALVRAGVARQHQGD
jgi:hypothetical protein